jgi:hypothetical protein
MEGRVIPLKISAFDAERLAAIQRLVGGERLELPTSTV